METHGLFGQSILTASKGIAGNKRLPDERKIIAAVSDIESISPKYADCRNLTDKIKSSLYGKACSANLLRKKMEEEGTVAYRGNKYETKPERDTL